jgi:hypothetical protein
VRRGIPAEVTTRGTGHAVRVAGLVGETEARALMANLRNEPGVTLPEVIEIGANTR